jgi:phage N-6-adenine-methyltransferase
MNKGMFTSKTEMWETPQKLFDELDKEFHFTLDVCASHKNAKCDSYLTKKQDGLSYDWYGNTCWMNPPYGRSIKKWVKKASECDNLVVGLLPARTDTKWFHDYVLNKAEIRFLKGRLHFSNSKNSAPFPSMVVIWHNH